MSARGLVYILAVLTVMAFKMINNNTVSEVLNTEDKAQISTEVDHGAIAHNLLKVN